MLVSIPNNNIAEREYSVNVILKLFLGLDYTIKYINTKDYIIDLDNANTLTIKDAFFSKFKNSTNYLQKENIPKKASLLKSEFYKEITVIFGDNKIEVNKKDITLHADIFASTFFMLTRWEEHVNKSRDKHNRFPAEASLAFKNNFLDKPIVNEYVELIWNMLIHLGYQGERKARKFEMTLTHDVDLPRLWWNSKDFIKSIGGVLIKRKSLSDFFSLIKFKLKKKDPFNTFDYLMKISEDNNLKSHFFFMSGGTSNKDNFYNIEHPIILKLIKEIDQRGHKIGFHPSYNAYKDNKQFNKELKKLNSLSPQTIQTGREHFLRFEIPTTWQIWEDNNMTWDSTMSYHDKSGFRCGVCYEFPVFNILTRKQLSLIEKPLIVMEGSFITYQNKTPENVYREIAELIDTVKEFNGNFVFLWHNSAFNIGNFKKYQHLYEKIVIKNCN